MKTNQTEFESKADELRSYAKGKAKLIFDEVWLEPFDVGRQIGICARIGNLRHAKRTADVSEAGVDELLAQLRDWFDARASAA